MERLREMMNNSDNVMAESIGREVAAELGRPQSFDGAARAVLEPAGVRRRSTPADRSWWTPAVCPSTTG